MKELFPLQTFHQDAVLKRLSELYENEKDLDGKMPYDEETNTYSINGNVSINGNLDVSGETTFDNDVQVNGDAKLFENIVDKDGHKRFIEGEGTPLELEGFTPTYCKWSLSGTHLMFVVAGNVANGVAIAGNAILGSFVVPDWVYNKIYAVWGSNYIENKVVSFTADDFSSQTATAILVKSSNKISIVKSGATFTLTANRGFRIAFDLLIDNESAE